MSLVKGAQNPQAMIAQLASQNPQMKQVIDFIGKSGGDPQKAFYAACKGKGVDPQAIINMLK